MLSFARSGHLQFITRLPFSLPFDHRFVVTIKGRRITIQRNRQQTFTAAQW
ncbi:Uncharacterised protein [Vibrio cholerae]|nr:Uncharacterised protein [Vibrio cholerae]